MLNKAALAAQQSEAAFDALFETFRPRLEKMAAQVAFRNSACDEHDFMSAYTEQFWRVVKSFDPNKGEFEHLLAVALRMGTAMVIRKELQDRTFPSVLCDSSTMEDGDNWSVDTDKFMNNEFGAQLTVASTESIVVDNDSEALKERLEDAGASEEDVKAAFLLAAGYTDEMVADGVGRTGSSAAKKMWTQRCKARLIKYLGITTQMAVYMADDGSGVRLKHHCQQYQM